MTTNTGGPARTFGEGIIEDLNEMCDVLERGEALGVHCRIDVVDLDELRRDHDVSERRPDAGTES